MTADPFEEHGFGRNQAAVAGHSVAIVAMPAMLPIHPDEWVRAQCECGHFANFECPITLARINEVMSWPHPASEEAR